MEVVSRRVDLLDVERVVTEWQTEKITHVIHCAGVVGGMLDNISRPADYLTKNIQMGLNVLEAARRLKLAKVVVAGSSCMYPDSDVIQPFSPVNVWQGKPYEGNVGYGIAKRVVAEACWLYRRQYGLDAFCAVLPNLYGPGADGSERGHFVAGVARKLLNAKKAGAESVQMMGDGTATRELIYVEDAARALIYALENALGGGPENFGVGAEHSIREVVELIAFRVGYEGKLEWGSPEDNGQWHKLMATGGFDGWWPRVSLPEGLSRTVEAMKG